MNLSRASLLCALLAASCGGGPQGVTATIFDAGFAGADATVIPSPDAMPVADGGDAMVIADGGDAMVGPDVGDGADGGDAMIGPDGGDGADGGDAMVGPDVGDGADGGDAMVGPDVGDGADGGDAMVGLDRDAPAEGGVPDVDAGLVDTGVIPDQGVLTDGGAAPMVLIENFGDPANTTFTCPNGTVVNTGTAVVSSIHCVGFSSSRCPAQDSLPGPGAPECLDPMRNRFIGVGQCVTDFFSCFGAGGTCTPSSMNRVFTWGSGSVQNSSFSPGGQLIEARYRGPGATSDCVVAQPGPAGSNTVVYTRQ